MYRQQYRNEYLKSPHWRQFRKSAKKHLPMECPCGARSGLDLHHLTYDRLGRERLDDVAWLCRDCHDALHRDDPAGGLFDPSRYPQRETPRDEQEERRRAHAARIRLVNKAKRKARRLGDEEAERRLDLLSRHIGY